MPAGIASSGKTLTRTNLWLRVRQASSIDGASMTAVSHAASGNFFPHWKKIHLFRM
jgi:hypothetical protein